MPGKVFINYRRSDEAGFTQALFLQLEAALGRPRLFMDVEGYIKAGDDFVQVLQQHVANSDVVLAVIGPRWMEARDEGNRRRLDDPDDFVRIEIVSALEQGKRVIPVLVNNAPMIRPDELPEPLRPLAGKQAVSLRPDRFPADCLSLIRDIRAALEIAEPLPEAAGGANAGTVRSSSAATAAAPTARPETAKSSSLVVGMVFIVLAILSAWIGLSLFRDPETSRPVVVPFVVASLFFFFIGFVVIRHEFKRRRERPIT